MQKFNRLLIALIIVIISGCKMAGETKSGWYTVQLKDEFGETSGKTILQVNGEALSRGLHQAVLQYHTNYRSGGANEETRELFVIITNRRKSEDYIIVTTPDDNTYSFHVNTGGLIFDKQEEPGDEDSAVPKFSSITKLVALMSQYDRLKISQGSFYFSINTAGFSNE